MKQKKTLLEKIRLLFFLGFKFLNINKKGKINIIFFVLFISISIGLTTLIVVIGVMNGLQDNLISRRIEIGSYHIVINKKGYKNFSLKEAGVLKKELYYDFSEIQAAIPFVEKESILKINKGISSEEQIIKIRAVDPEELKKDSKFLKYVGIKENELLLGKNNIILGKELWKELFEGDYLNKDYEVYLTPDISLKSYQSNGVLFNVTNIFKSNSYDYDRYWGFISIYALEKLSAKAEVDSIGIKLFERSQEKEVLKKLKKKYKDEYIIKSAEEINSGYFTALKLEKIMILLLFYMIFLMISLNTFGALKLKIIEKKIDIGILKAIGLSSLDVKILFLINSISISFFGSLFGNLFGFFVGFNIKNIFFVTEKVVNFILMYFRIILEKINPGLIFNDFKIYDETIYYQNTFFVKFAFNELVMINLSIIIMTIIFSYIPVLGISKLKPIEIIKNV